MLAKCKLFLFVFFLLFFISASEASAQVVINEFSPSTLKDWVEIHNTNDSLVDLSVYRIRDTTDNNKKDLFGSLEAGGVVSFDFGRSLNKDGDTVKLILVDGENETLVDSISYGGDGNLCLPSEQGSIGRAPDGSSTIERFSIHTRDFLNGTSNLDPCPSPTPETTPTPTHGPTSTPTSTPTKTPTATPKPTVKAVVTKKPKIISTKTTSDEEETGVLGLREGLEVPSPTPIPEPEEKGKIPITAVLFVLGGLGFMGVAGYPFLKSMKKRYNIRSEEETGAEGGFKSGDN